MKVRLTEEECHIRVATLECSAPRKDHTQTIGHLSQDYMCGVKSCKVKQITSAPGMTQLLSHKGQNSTPSILKAWKKPNTALILELSFK